MSKRKRKNTLYLKRVLYIFISSFLLLLVLSILPMGFEKKAIITPIVKSDKTGELDLSKLLLDNNIEFMSIDLASDYFNVKLKDSGNVYISLKKNIQVQISSLQAVLKQLTIDGKRFNLIDFRFKKPVIKYTN